MPFEQIFPYLLPPLLGAFIGYVTNHIAIRMLFRPLRPWHVLGVRVPLTPGIIPAKRGELAEKMGEMVGNHLLTSADVGRALENAGFRRELQEVLHEKLATFLDRDLGPAASLVPAPYQERFRDLVGVVRAKIVGVVFTYLESAEFETQLRRYLREQGEELLARDLQSFLTPERYDRLRRHLDDRIGDLLRAPAVGRGVAQFVDGKVEEWLASERPLRELLPADLVETLLAQLDKEIPPLLEKFGGLLYDPDFRRRLIAKAKEAIDAFLDSLGGFAGLLSGFINMEKLHARLPEFLDRAAEEIARWLREEKTQAQVAAMLRERIDRFLDQPPGALLERLPYEKVAGARRYLRRRVTALVQSRRAAETALDLVERGIGRVKDRSFASLLEQTLPAGGLDRAQELVADRLLAALRSPQARQAFAAVLAAKGEEWLFRAPLGKLSARLPADVREELEAGLYTQIAELLKREVPPLVESLNVRRMVAEKVNTLDLLQIEALLMGIMQEQFKYINLFGALLGALIGLLNILLLHLS